MAASLPAPCSASTLKRLAWCKMGNGKKSIFDPRAGLWILIAANIIAFSDHTLWVELALILFHAFPHAVVDLLPSFAQMLGLCLANAAIVERVFSLSGLGYLIIDAVVKRDSPGIHAAVLVLALTLVLLDTAAELLQYGLRSDMRAVGGRA